MKSPRVNLEWIAKLPQDLQFVVSDVEVSWMRAKTRGANRRQVSREMWDRAAWCIEPIRDECLARKPNRAKIRRLVEEAARLFDGAAELAQPPAEPSPAFKKTTMLDGYYATADGDSFVFDRCPGPNTHRDKWRGRFGHPDCAQMSPEPRATARACRVYPEALLPLGAADLKGKWRVTVEFWLDEQKNSQLTGKGKAIRISPRFKVDPGAAKRICQIEARALCGLRRRKAQ